MIVRGKVVDTKGLPNHHSYEIEGEDGGRYFAHAGDLDINEQRIYGDPIPNSSLENGDDVEFELLDYEPPLKRAMHVKKI